MSNHVQTPPGNGYRMNPDQVPLKEHFDEIVDAKLGRIEQMLTDRDKALLVALAALEQRFQHGLAEGLLAVDHDTH